MAICQLSVVIPCYNAGQFLSGAIESVINQQSPVQSLEVIVIDDRSTDCETLEVLRQWEDTGPSNVRILRNDRNCGIATARNLGIEAARGAWIAFLDADDLWIPGGLGIRWEVTQRHPDAEWISADFLLCEKDGSVRSPLGHFEQGVPALEILGQAFSERKVLRLNKPIREFLHSSLAWTGTVMVKKSLIQRVGGFDAGLRRAQDLHMWIRLAKETDLFFVPKPVALYRQHPASISHEDAPPDDWSVAAYNLLLGNPSFREFRPIIRHKIGYFHRQNAYFHRLRGNKQEALKAAFLAVRYNPLEHRSWKNLLAASLWRR